MEVSQRVIISTFTIAAFMCIVLPSATEKTEWAFTRIFGETGSFIIRALGWLGIAKSLVITLSTDRHSTLWKVFLTVLFFMYTVGMWYKPDSQQFSISSNPQALNLEFEDHCNTLTQIYTKIKDHLTEIDGLYTMIENQLTLIDYHRSKIEDFSTIMELGSHTTKMKNYKTEIEKFIVLIPYHVAEVSDLVNMSDDQIQKIIHLVGTRRINFKDKFREFLRMFSTIQENLLNVEKRRSYLDIRLKNFGSFSNLPNEHTNEEQNQKSSITRITWPTEIVRM